MDDIIFKTKGKEIFRIPFPTFGTKCPETKLEVKEMTEYQPTPQTPEQVADGLRNAFRQAMKDGVMDATPYLKQMTYKSDIEKTEAEIKVLQKKLELLKEIETHKSQPRMNLENEGKFEIVSYNDEVYYRLDFAGMNHNWYKKKTDNGVILVKITDGETHRLLEGMWFNDVKKGKYDEVEWDEKDNPKPVDEVVDRLIKKYQAQKLWNRVRDELGYSIDCCDEIVDLVESWLPEPQSAAGSQNVDTELLVDGFNHCLQKMKEMLR
jgi:hypothetical protein